MSQLLVKLTKFARKLQSTDKVQATPTMKAWGNLMKDYLGVKPDSVVVSVSVDAEDEYYIRAVVNGASHDYVYSGGYGLKALDKDLLQETKFDSWPLPSTKTLA